MRGSALCPPGPAPRHLRPLFSDRVCLRLHYLSPGCLQPAAGLSPKSLLLLTAPKGPFHNPGDRTTLLRILLHASRPPPPLPSPPVLLPRPPSSSLNTLSLLPPLAFAHAVPSARDAPSQLLLPRSCSVSCVQGWVSAHSQAEWAARYLEAPSIQIRLTLQGSISRLPMGTTPALRVNSQRS